MHQLVLLAALPQLVDLLCDLCKSGHSDLVFIFPNLNVTEIEKARDNLYLYDDTSAQSYRQHWHTYRHGHEGKQTTKEQFD